MFDFTGTVIFLLILLVVASIVIVRYRLVLDHYRGLLVNYFNFNTKTTTLFEKYGGLQTIQAVVDSAVTNLLAEPSLGNVFAVVGTPNHRTGVQLKSCLDLQCSALFGGPFQYPSKTFTRGVTVNARSMKASHKGLKITKAQNTTFTNILVQTLLDAGVTQADVNTLAPGLQAMAKDIIEVE